MSRRYTVAEDCPLDGAPVKMGVCQTCRFFRGAASSRHERPDGVAFKFPHGWEVHCNWPRDGAFLDPQEPRHDHP